MLEDRDYMRQPEYEDSFSRRFRWSATMILLVAYVVVFIAELICGHYFPAANRFFYQYLALSKEGIFHGYIWQFVTYQFMHAGVLHLIFNGWAIYTFGRELEQLLGVRRFLTLLLSSGVIGGVFQISVALIWSHLFGGWVVGASAGAFGLVAAYAAMFPNREFTMLVMYIIPVTMAAQKLLIFSAVLAVAGIVFPIDNMANAAHLGGMAMGWFFVKKIMQREWSAPEETLRVFDKKEARKADAPPEEEDAASFVQNQVDPILEKISAKGINSLTKREREILEAARKKIGRP